MAGTYTQIISANIQNSKGNMNLTNGQFQNLFDMD